MVLGGFYGYETEIKMFSKFVFLVDILNEGVPLLPKMLEFISCGGYNFSHTKK